MTPGRASAHAAPVSCVAFRADGRRLASGSYDGGVLVWTTADLARPHVLTEFAHRGAVLGAAWNPAAADLLATGSADGTAGVWRIVDDRPPHLMKVLGGHPAPVTSVHWMPDGQHLLCQLADGRAAVWQAFGETFLGEIKDCVRLDVSPAGLVATAGTDGTVAVRDLARDTVPMARRAAPAVEAFAWSPDGATLALARRDGVIKLRNAHLDPIRSVRPGDLPLRAVTWSPDGLYLIAGAYDGTLIAVDATGRQIWRQADPAVRPQSVAVGGTVLAAATFHPRPYLASFAGGPAAQPGGGPMGYPGGGPAGYPGGGPAGHPGGGPTAHPGRAPAPVDPAAPRPLPVAGGVVAAAGRMVTAGPVVIDEGSPRPVVIAEHDLRVAAIDVLADRVVASAAHRAVRVTRLGPGFEVERAVTLQCPEPVRTVALLGTHEATVVVAASYDFRIYAWTVDWSGPPVGPRLAGEFGAGVAALQRLDDHRLTATDHRGELVILALGADGALSS